ncbi:hypothetical protein GGG16DRAFT_55400 [Schizophyllum commune]
MSSVPTVDMSPKGLLNDNGNYVLQHEDIATLLKYVQSGVLLPDTESAYQNRIQYSNDTANKLSDVIKPLVAVYATTQGHCKKFNDETYPGIVHLSNNVYSYAQTAGGTVDDSYYAAILDWIRRLSNSTDPDEQVDLKAAIDDLVKVRSDDIDALQSRANQAIEDLKAFEKDTQKDQDALKARKKAVEDKIRLELGSIDELNDKLKTYRKEMEDDMKECEHDRVIAQSSAAYVWLFPFGTIAAASVAKIFTDKADALERRIKEVKQLIADFEQKKTDETRLSGDLTAIDTDLNGVLALIQPCIHAIQGMKGEWTAISNDLGTIKELLNEDFKRASEAVATLEAKKLVADWNDLKESVNKYRDVAFIADVSTVTMDEYVTQLHEASK